MADDKKVEPSDEKPAFIKEEGEQAAEYDKEIKVGDNVYYSKYSGNEVKIDEKECLICKESDILAVLEESKGG